ncbi:MAG: fumarylacetoacetate hydrolase family protein [Rhodoferax sp.]|nr:fumarylacetoacetate hydrolase family protein [Rhodoferax sp.]
MRPLGSFWPCGTVYGVLLNFRAELAELGQQMQQAPYMAEPKAPVLYVKPANTWSGSGSAIVLPAQAGQVEVGASVAMVIGEPNPARSRGPARASVAGYVLVNDLSLPHSSFFRPPVKVKCPDGFLGLGPVWVPAAQAGDPAGFVLDVAINGVLRQSVYFSDLVRAADTLLDDVGEFMTLRCGDLLLLGCDRGRPLAAAGDQVEIGMRNQAAFGSLCNTLLLAPQEGA